jgi:uncharacterized protein with NRDE domain
VCVLAFSRGVDPRWPLILAGNRDERHDRPTAPLARWRDNPELLAGRDLEGGGTWLGVSSLGRLATVTNVRRPGGPEPGRPSRGRLVQDVLMGADPALSDLADYNPFNLLLFDADGGSLLSNAPAPARRPLRPGLYGLANGPLDEPAGRVLRLKAGLAAWLEAGSGGLDGLFDLLGDDHAPDSHDSTPVFIRNLIYGTRCSTVVRVDAQGRGEMVERRFDAAGGFIGESALTFVWPAPG